MTLRVLFVQGAAERAGAERVLASLVRSLDGAEVSPEVAFLAEGPFVEEVASFGVPVHLLESPGRLRDVGRVRGAIRALGALVTERQADLVHANGEKMSFYAGWAARRAARPAIFWLHDAPASGIAARLAQRAMARSPHAAVVTCARWMVPAFAAACRLRAEAIHNGVHPGDLPAWARPAFAGGPAPAAPEAGPLDDIKRVAGWPADAIVFTHVARLQRWKGAEVFLQAAALTSRAVPAARFLVVGGALYGREEGYAASLPRLATSLGLDGTVVFTGNRPDGLEILAASDVVAHCALVPEPFPMVILEAMATGRAVVATRTLGPEEAIEDGRTGLLVPPGDHRAMAEAFCALAAGPALRASLGAAAAAGARDRFSAARMAREFEALYRRVAAREPATTRGAARG